MRNMTLTQIYTSRTLRAALITGVTASAALLSSTATAGVCGTSLCGPGTHPVLKPISNYSYSAQSQTSQQSSQYVSFTGSRPAGLGANETLIPTQCPVAVHNPSGGQVLGCYAVAKPVPVYTPRPVRVVRPVIYVRYPVPVPVCGLPVCAPPPPPPCYTGCNSGGYYGGHTTIYRYSRYGR